MTAMRTLLLATLLLAAGCDSFPGALDPETPGSGGGTPAPPSGTILVGNTNTGSSAMYFGYMLDCDDPQQQAFPVGQWIQAGMYVSFEAPAGCWKLVLMNEDGSRGVKAQGTLAKHDTLSLGVDPDLLPLKLPGGDYEDKTIVGGVAVAP